MNIESAKYYLDEDGKKAGVKITYDGGKVTDVPLESTNWMSNALQAYVDDGGEIEEAD